MGLIEWNENFSVGIKHLDVQHQNLIIMLNELYEAMRKGQGKSLIEQILNKMVEYTAVHFKSEETLFIKYEYPLTKKHKLEHEVFVKNVLDFKQKFEKGNVLLSVEVMNFLVDWLINHINGSDKSYGPYLNSKGEY